MMTGIIIAAVLILAIVVLPVFMRKLRPNTVYILGEHLAKAAESERQRKSRGDMEKSPMPDGKYDFWGLETSPLNPAPNALDSPLREVCQRFAKSDAPSRAQMRASISEEEFDTLLTFSKRAAVFGIRERNAAWVVDGLTALAMIKGDWVDFRDVLVSTSLLHHSAARIGQDATQLLRAAAALSEPRTAEIINNFINRPPEDKVLRATRGYAEVETNDGIEFIEGAFSDYNPTYELTGKSPMPDGKYDFWRGESSLINPAPSALDSPLRELCQRYAQSDLPSRVQMRISISEQEFRTLLAFSERAAVFGIRERNAGWIVDGLTALAMIKGDRVDYRDVLMSTSLLHHSAERIGQDATQLLRAAAALSEPRTAEFINNFINRPPEDKVLRAKWGRDEVETKDGIGFIGWRYSNDYNPTCDLKKLALDLADHVAADKYQPSYVEVGSQLPGHWLKTKDSASLDKSLQAVRGSATIDGRLRPHEHPEHERQWLTIFLVEVAEESAAQTLLDLSNQKKPTDYCMLGLAEGKLFCLVVERSYVPGNAFETPDSLARFSPGITRILRRYAGKN
jgi:hypothetical protein